MSPSFGSLKKTGASPAVVSTYSRSLISRGFVPLRVLGSLCPSYCARFLPPVVCTEAAGGALKEGSDPNAPQPVAILGGCSYRSRNAGLPPGAGAGSSFSCSPRRRQESAQLTWGGAGAGPGRGPKASAPSEWVSGFPAGLLQRCLSILPHLCGAGSQDAPPPAPAAGAVRYGDHRCGAYLQLAGKLEHL